MTNAHFLQKKPKGALVIDILIASFFIVSALASLLVLANLSLKASLSANKETEAKSLVQAAAEAVRNFRDNTDWQSNGLGTMTLGISYRLGKSPDSSYWILNPGEEQIKGFLRKIIFENARRDQDYNIVESGGSEDADTKKVTIIISWQEKQQNHQLSLVTYFTNWH